VSDGPRVHQRVLIEAAVDNEADAVAAWKAGADRLELCARLDLDGLTPDVALLRAVKQAVPIPVAAMARREPAREGDFTLTDAMLADMLRDVDALSPYADALVFGGVLGDGTIDVARTRLLVERAGPGRSVFHRAFDRVSDADSALDVLISLKIRRVLTSGLAASAGSEEGVACLARLVEGARGRIEILPGGGVRASNGAAILRRTGCRQLHTSARSGGPGGPRFDPEALAALRAAVDAAGSA